MIRVWGWLLCALGWHRWYRVLWEGDTGCGECVQCDRCGRVR